MAKIDRTMVQRLIQTQLSALSAGGVCDVLFPGDEDKEDSTRWVRLVAIDFDPIPGSKPNDVAVSDHPEYARLTVTLSVYCAPSLMKQSSGALSSALSHLGVNIEHVCLRDSGTTHQVDLGRMQISFDKPGHGEQAGIASAGVSIDGMVCRQAGETLITTP